MEQWVAEDHDGRRGDPGRGAERVGAAGAPPGSVLGLERLRCPETGSGLVFVGPGSGEWDRWLGIWKRGAASPETGVVGFLTRVDGAVAYPLLGFNTVDMLTQVVAGGRVRELTGDEMGALQHADPEGDGEAGVYARWAEESMGGRGYETALRFLEGVRDSGVPEQFPDPAHVWLRPSPAMEAERQALVRLEGVAGRDVMQVGGRGVEGLMMLLAGARSLVVVGPIPGELHYGARLAGDLGLSDRCLFVRAYGERLPLGDRCVDRILCRSTLHHMVVHRGLAEFERVLGPGGRWATIDIWRARHYERLIGRFGKFTPDVHCRPLDDLRLQCVDGHVRVTWHGASLRYPLVLLQRKGWILPGGVSARLGRVEERLGARFPYLERHASLVVMSGGVG